MRMLQAAEGLPVNLGFLGKGNSSLPEPLEEQIRAGACGLKLHEDWGTTPAAIDCCLAVADRFDVQVAIHTDTLNESGFVEDTIAAIKGRTIHTYHTEGAGGGHAPDIIKHRRPAQRAALEHQPDPAVHRQHHRRAPRHADGLPSPVAARCRRTWPLPRAASAAETIARRGRAARPRHHQHVQLRLAGDGPGRRGDPALLADGPQDEGAVRPAAPATAAATTTTRAKRYVAKYTINPALTHGIAQHVGSIEPGKWADLVLWKPAFFGVKPELVLKGG